MRNPSIVTGSIAPRNSFATAGCWSNSTRATASRASYSSKSLAPSPSGLRCPKVVLVGFDEAVAGD